MRFLSVLTSLIIITGLSACSPSQVLNPFYEPPSPVALKGNANDHALSGSVGKIDTAREALEQMASYRRALTPQPVNPVIQPAVVRLMWIPDHLNSHGDLIPEHYYYLKVLQDRFAVQDAFELESQLGKPTSSVPFVYGDTK